MEIALSSKGDYAVRAVLDLSRHYGHGLRKAREIAGDMRIPKNFLSLILADFVRSGLLIAVVGREGGYKLAKPPGAITLLEVVELSEGPIELADCILRDIPCSSSGICAAHNAWSTAQQALRARLGSTTFATLMREDDLRIGTPAAAGAGPRRSMRAGSRR